MEAKRMERARIVALVLGTVATMVVAAACSSEDEAPKAQAQITPVANSAEAELPVDAVPSPDGSQIYFIASSRAADEDGIGQVRSAGVYKVAATGGPVTKLFAGEPLASPYGIAISDDGKTLFLADSSADTTEDRSDGRIFTLSGDGGTPSALAGTEGTSPRGVEVRGETVWFTGRKDGQAGLFKTGLGGGSATLVAGGMADPSGVAISSKGEAFVLDSGSVVGERAGASLLHVAVDGRVDVVVEGITVGHPAGVALTKDERTAVVSGLDPGTGTDLVFTVDLASKGTAQLTDKFGEYLEAAGLHRAKNADVYAWADSHANKTGTVFAITLGQ